MNAPPAPSFFIGRLGIEGPPFDAWSQQSLLASLEQAGLDWPSSCRNGTCRTCIGQLVSGRIRYQIEWPGLSAEEKAEGYVLPCAAFACSDLVLKR
ncbi:2Fe-2S iron-sulfur cluster-binding protein [Rhodoferax sp.]|uniref:2Fe-2S iron-sulfur cluster-binding protein n=1 Tax=Rhodoferax sp. TaxID=50421 RepID=UPI00374CA18D